MHSDFNHNAEIMGRQAKVLAAAEMALHYHLPADLSFALRPLVRVRLPFSCPLRAKSCQCF